MHQGQGLKEYTDVWHTKIMVQKGKAEKERRGTSQRASLMFPLDLPYTWWVRTPLSPADLPRAVAANELRPEKAQPPIFLALRLLFPTYGHRQRTLGPLGHD